MFLLNHLLSDNYLKHRRGFILLCFSLLFSFSHSFSQSNNITISRNINVDSLKSQNYKILNATIKDSLLVITIKSAYSIKKTELLFSGNYKKSLPPVISLYLNLITDEKLKFKQKNKFTFNLSKTKYPGTNKIIIYLSNYSEVLYYNY